MVFDYVEILSINQFKIQYLFSVYNLIFYTIHLSIYPSRLGEIYDISLIKF